MFDLVIGVVGIAAFTLSTVLWIRASRIDIPDNIDTIVNELKRAARWNAWAALSAGVGSACAVMEFLRIKGWM